MALLCPIAAKALSGPVETSLRALLAEYDLDSGDGLLVSLTVVSENLRGFSISCEPPIGVGDLDDPRVLSVVATDSVDEVLKVIGGGERADVEFKSSMFLDLRRYRNEPGEALQNYTHDGVPLSLMKAIAGLANTGGGTVFVGVEDDTSICGLAEDFELADSRRRDFDGWDQRLRGLIESRFFEGRVVANYVRAVPFEANGLTFVRLQVGNRAALTFLRKGGGGAELYVRSGTRTIPIEYHDIEKHYALTRQF